MFPLGPDRTPWKTPRHRRRVQRQLRRPDDPAHRARGADRACLPGVPRRVASAAPGASRAAARDPRRPRGLGERPVRRARPAEERQHRRRRRAADVPGHRHRHRVRQEGPARLGRWATRRRRCACGVHRTYTETNLRYSQMAPLSMFEEVNTGNNLPVQFDIYASPGERPCRRVASDVRRQGRRLGQQDVPVPGDAGDPVAREAG